MSAVWTPGRYCDIVDLTSGDGDDREGAVTSDDMTCLKSSRLLSTEMEEDKTHRRASGEIPGVRGRTAGGGQDSGGGAGWRGRGGRRQFLQSVCFQMRDCGCFRTELALCKIRIKHSAPLPFMLHCDSSSPFLCGSYFVSSSEFPFV